MGKFAINGFGRIGRLTTREWFIRHLNNADLVAINTSGSTDLAGWAHLLKYDSSYGRFPANISIIKHQDNGDVTDQDPLLGHLVLDKNIKIPVLAQRDPAKLPWEKYEVNLVIESTGAFRTEKLAKNHLKAGAKQVLLSAPSKGGAVETVLLGVKDASGNALIYSNESCTTNCTAPVVSVIHKALGVKKAALTTLHAYTDDQKLQDGSHKDLRRARAAAVNLVPTSTGAAKATTRVVTDLKNRFDGISVRVPILTGSLSDLTFIVNRRTTREEVNKILEEASNSKELQGILAVTKDPIVSSDIVGRRESAIVDLGLTKVIDGDLVKVFAWYDNEWGYSCRLAELAVALTR